MKEHNEHKESPLSHIKKENPFGTPEAYFETFSKRLNSRIRAEEKPVPRLQWLSILKPVLGLAASFALVFFLLYVPLENFLPGIWNNYLAKHPGNTVQTDAPGDSYFETLMDYQVFSSSDDLQILSALTDADNTMSTDTLTSQQIEDYIVMNSSDLEILRNYNQ
ncbi:EI24 domain-containing protein [Prolixibacter sp. SD074]|uniref:EI24 domain-containing protein n=1 Tax=Prolixibacter sp. SD074 TaxID=2652391 RepID=UPI001280922A|nr:EI24 domain-containing protein [Prolixibacter sp. SD074]GET27946.1 hypothetical protein SD074_01480 [Prolixibacter sp. SD074]